MDTNSYCADSKLPSALEWRGGVDCRERAGDTESGGVIGEYVCCKDDDVCECVLGGRATS